MPRFAANLSFLFTEVPFLDRFEKAARAGFRGVEFHYPYDSPSYEVEARLDAFGLAPVLHNIWSGATWRGEWGLACLPGRQADFRGAVAQAIDYAHAIGTPRLNCLAGKVPDGVERRECLITLSENLTWAAREFDKAGLILLVEPLNHVDVPDFLLTNTRDTLAVLDRIGKDNVKLQYDIYHMQMMEGNLAATLERLLPRIGHIQFADNPGRHEPGTGEINFPFLFRHIDAISAAGRYTGWVGAEYRPSKVTEDSLLWLLACE